MGIDTPLAVLSDKTISRYLIILNSFLHRLQTRQSMRSVKKLLLLPVYMLVKTETFWKQQPENCHVLKINNPILTNTDLLKIKTYETGGLQGSGSSNSLL